jgi:hypothetical protein
MMAGESKVTTDHKEIRKWVEETDGRPAPVKGTGLLRIDYKGFGNDDALEEISWEDFFEKSEEKKQAFLYQEKSSSGETSRFSKFFSRNE